MPTVFVIDDDPTIIKALRWLLESVRLKVETFESPLPFLKRFNPQFEGCILTDVRMPDMSGLELLEKLQAKNNHLPVVFISGHADISIAVRAMKAGAADFILKPFHDQNLLDVIQKILVKKQEPMLDYKKPEYKKIFSQLTARQSEVLALIVEGKLNKQIASELDISLSTVEAHRAQLMRKLQAKNLADLIRIALTVHHSW